MTDSDRRKDYGPTGCVGRSFTLLLMVVWVAVISVVSRPLGGRIKSTLTR